LVNNRLIAKRTEKKRDEKGREGTKNKKMKEERRSL